MHESNLYFQVQVFPKELKFVNEIPVFKAGD